MTGALGILPVYSRAGARWLCSGVADALIFGRLKLTAGGNTVQTVQGKITEGGMADEANERDHTVVGIIAKAKRAIRQLVDTLRDGQLGDSWVPSKVTFTLFTTKTVRDAARTRLLKGFKVDCGGRRPIHVEGHLSSKEETIALFEPEHRLLVGPLTLP